jgi:hypothetical protein
VTEGVELTTRDKKAKDAKDNEKKIIDLCRKGAKVIRVP